MKKEKKTFDLLKAITMVIKPKKPVKKYDRSDHQPSWMYRNE